MIVDEEDVKVGWAFSVLHEHVHVSEFLKEKMRLHNFCFCSCFLWRKEKVQQVCCLPFPGIMHRIVFHGLITGTDYKIAGKFTCIPIALGMRWAVVTGISPVYTCVYENCMHDFSRDFAILNVIFQMSDRQCVCEVNRGQSERKQPDTISLYLLSWFLPYQ